MKAVKPSIAVMILMYLLILSPSPASARVGFHVGFGHGHFAWHGGYRHHRVHRRWHHPRHFCAPAPVIVVDTWRRRRPVIIEKHIVVERPTVIERTEVIVETPQQDEDTTKLYRKLRNKKSQLLKRLQLGDSQQRKKAIRELAGFSFDDNVRESLEKVLLSDPDPQLRIEAAKAFAGVRNKDALAVLKKVRIADPDAEVRSQADIAITTIEGS